MHSEKKIRNLFFGGVLLLALSACTLGQDYQRPETLVPIQFKNGAPWKEARPSDAVAKGNWWELYHDPVLNGLEENALQANQNLRAAYARLSQVQANLGISRSNQLPRLDLNANGGRQRTAASLTSPGQDQLSTQLNLPLVLSYEVDLWGRVRRSIEASTADVESARADYQSLMLTLQAELARNYFTLRAVDNETRLLQQTIELRRSTLSLVKSKFENGRVSQLDLSQAESELATVEAEAIGLKKRRGELENLIAVLMGLPASNFSLAQVSLRLSPPTIAPGLPSDLLERRPDVAAAERKMAAASARIGVAKTAFFPAISLTGSTGFASNETSSLFNWDNRTWGLGPAISLPIFDYGRNSAKLDKSRAVYEEAIANYRQQVLVAFQEVENGLNGLQVLHEQGKALQRATTTATLAWEISEKRYRSGLVSYLEVVDTQRSALLRERALVQLRGEQMSTSVLLIKALGGSWLSDTGKTN
ncbi:efflux transporter outer membrane subunit [Desulfotalea psychrophila]|uniref:Related to outer membrane lipoprotein n=1 Tax=Desulfotalea psychrophila (strain LSv54 / DSM 12343) TaxID=177439 RepID=Q6ALC5_DESPS|nr:efflux transporter outer membrane subunit [Desulfotalea psychrophila]CAG36850.1 related to outer membrane lipoprotein [Desulfotalea psychrophila LSv54]